MEKTRWSDRLFTTWVAVGVCWAATACVVSRLCPSFGHHERTFLFVGRTVDPTSQVPGSETVPLTPEEEAELQAQQDKQDKIDRCENALEFLVWGSLVLALSGVVAFFRRGCFVFVLAAALVLVCYG